MMSSREVIANIRDSDNCLRLTPYGSFISNIELTKHSGRCQVTATFGGIGYAGYGKTVIEAFEDLIDNITSTFRRELIEMSIGFHQYSEAKRKKTHGINSE